MGRTIRRITNYLDKSDDLAYFLPIAGGIKSYRRRKSELESKRSKSKIDKMGVYFWPIAGEAGKVASIASIAYGIATGNVYGCLGGAGLYPMLTIKQGT